jgi:hypothetical protein
VQRLRWRLGRGLHTNVGNKTKPFARNGPDKHGLAGGVTQSFPDEADRLVDVIFFNDQIEPHSSHQVFFADYLAPVVYQHYQGIERARAQLYHFTCSIAQPSVSYVKLEALKFVNHM